MDARTRLIAAACFCAICAPRAGAQRPTFSSESQIVVLHVAVRDRHGYVNGLEQQAFRVFENEQPQSVSYFSNQDAPVTIGLVIDGSGSMRPNRERVIAASLAFARQSNPSDDIFVLGFNEHIHTPLPESAPFTRDSGTLRIALARAIAAEGKSAVYDAVDAGLGYLERGHYERKVLVLVSDGGDNASAMTKAQVLANAEASNAVIYTVGIIDPLETEKDPGFLRQLADASGGESFEPRSLSDVGKAFDGIARDIRSMYTIGYAPNHAVREEMRKISVRATLPDGRTAKVRTRRAYLAAANLDSQVSDDR